MIYPRIILLLILVFFLKTSATAQKVISGNSAVMPFEMKGVFKRGIPPNLYAELQFSDENGNGIVEAEEKALLKLILINKGKGVAQGLKIRIKEESKPDNELSIQGEFDIQYLHPDKSVEFTIPISAGFNISTAEHKFKITVMEYFGYDMDPAYLVLNTLEYQSPELVVSGYEVVDYGQGTGAIIEDNQLQPGEMVKVKVYIQNIGNNIARGVNYTVTSKDPNVYVENTTGELPDLAIGEVKNFWMTVSPNKRIDPDKDLSLFVTVEVNKKKGGLKDQVMMLALNRKPPETEILEVKPDMEKFRKQVARFEYTSNKFTANVGSVLNIRDVPLSATRRTNAVAVVFGIENYDELPPAPYAENDARIIQEYFQNLLGIETVVTYTSDRARGLVFDDVFNPNYGELQRAIIKDVTDVFVFYSGHGIPSKNGEQIFLFPSDGKIARLDMQGYDLNILYKNLESLGARSVTVFLDACFSGASKHSEKIRTENLVAMKGVRVKPKLIQPWDSDSSFTVLTSSAANETSLALDVSQTGLFTYYVCAGLKGEADANNDMNITLGELYEYVRREVFDISKKISGIQTPQLYGNPESVLVSFQPNEQE